MDRNTTYGDAIVAAFAAAAADGGGRRRLSARGPSLVDRIADQSPPSEHLTDRAVDSEATALRWAAHRGFGKLGSSSHA